jgi:hypothetical protein
VKALPLLLVALVLSACGGGREGQSSVSDRAPELPPDQATLARVEQIATHTATQLRDSALESARVYATTRKTANLAAARAEVDSDQPVYLIVLHGTFVAVGVPHPAGAVPDAKGHIVRLVWDPATDSVTDWGIGNNEPDTAKLGRGLPLDISVSS